MRADRAVQATGIAGPGPGFNLCDVLNRLGKLVGQDQALADTASAAFRNGGHFVDSVIGLGAERDAAIARNGPGVSSK